MTKRLRKQLKSVLRERSWESYSQLSVLEEGVLNLQADSWTSYCREIATFDVDYEKYLIKARDQVRYAISWRVEVFRILTTATTFFWVASQRKKSLSIQFPFKQIYQRRGHFHALHSSITVESFFCKVSDLKEDPIWRKIMLYTPVPNFEFR